MGVPADLAFANPGVVAATEFALRLGLRVTRRAVWEAFAALPAYPAVRLAEVQEVFDRWGIPCVAFQPGWEALPGLRLPLMASIDGEALGGAAGRLPVVITAVGADMVDFFHPARGACRVAAGRFRAAWSGILFAAVADGHVPDPGHDAALLAERQEMDAYRASVRLVPGFLTQAEASALVAHCERQAGFRRSLVARHGDPAAGLSVSGMRTSSTAVLRERSDPLPALVYARVAALAGVAPADVEDLQCTRYAPGESFDAHVDGMGRVHTVLVYLNDGFAGGETAFPDIGLAVPPRAGTALVFRNLDGAGRAIPWSRHAGLPCEGGTKYVCNAWVRGDAPA